MRIKDSQVNTTSHTVSYDPRAFTIDGQRTLLLSGAIHYPRSTPEQWPDLLRRSREAGLNTIETYVFWNLHETRQGVYDFSGRLNLPHFCELVQAAGMHLVLRIGPYICAETNYGGLPFWLRDVPGIQFRTLNAPWQREMARWTRFVADLLHPYFAPQGGPIILAQIENEYDLIRRTYGAAGQKYLAWASTFAESLQLGIPWVMCLGGAPGTIETLNGFAVHDQIPAHRRKHPDQPLLWTEHWTGWYDTWGYPHHERDPREVAYAAVRFIAGGGTGVNYYMWHGGTNFGREGMYLQTTSYDYDAPLDEYGRPTTKYHHLARLHRVLNDHAAELLQCDEPVFQQLSAEVGCWRYGDLAFLCNDSPTQSALVVLDGQPHECEPQSARVILGDQVVFDSAQIDPTDRVPRAIAPFLTRLTFTGCWAEPIPGERTPALPAAEAVRQPMDQLKLTHDTTDYCWYVTTLTLNQPLEAPILTLDGMADIAHIFLDDQLVSTTAEHILSERRTFFDGRDFAFAIALPPLDAGQHTLALLCIGAGLIKGDWTIGHRNMVTERKGIWGAVEIQDEALPEPWTISPGLVGEAARIHGDGGVLVPWRKARERRPLTWWRFTFPHPGAIDALALDLANMTRGQLWLNGQPVGRYWLKPGEGQSLVPQYAQARSDAPTQRYYHLPHAWLRPQNILVIFDELGGDPAGVRLVRP